MKKRNYVYQLNTDNYSFLKMSKLLQDLGVKNNMFILKLYDETLMDVDPLDENNLTQEQILRISREIKRNIWYYLRQIVRVPVPGNLKGKRYQIHRGNLALTWLMMNNINGVEELPRQNYKSISAICNYSYIYNFATTGSNISFFNKRVEDSKENLNRLNLIIDLLPSYLQRRHKKDDNNKTYLRSYERKNSVTARPTAISEEAADILGRGSTEPSQWYDEFAFLKYNKIIYNKSCVVVKPF